MRMTIFFHRFHLPLLFFLLLTTLFTALWLFIVQEKGVGLATGVAGYFLFALTLLLSSRCKKLENYLGGLDTIYPIHHQIGLLSFILILIHTLALAARWLPHRLDKFFLFFLPFQSRWFVNVGSLSLWLMIFLIGLTLLKILPYNKWKITHKAMSLAFLLASLHILFFGKTFQSPGFFTNLLFIPFLIGLFGISYKQLFLPLFAKQPLYEVVGTKKLNDNVIEIILHPKGDPLTYIPGQYVFFSFRGNKLTRESHPFTLLKHPDESTVSILVKSRGDYTRSLIEELLHEWGGDSSTDKEGSRRANLKYLPDLDPSLKRAGLRSGAVQQIQPGYTAHLEGPYGRLDFTKANPSQIWIAGGIGIVLFIAWVRSLKQLPENLNIDLFYCTHRKEDILLADELAEASRHWPNFRYFLFCSEENNRIDAQKVMTLARGLEGKDILMCGPKRLTSDMTQQLLALEVKRKNIHFEEFEFL